jgi:hypothetical protein
MMPSDILQTIIDLNQIEGLDLADIKYFSRHELDKLIKHFPRLHSLTMKYHPLFVVPSQIRTLRFENSDRAISIDNLSHTIPHVKTLEIPIQTKDGMVSGATRVFRAMGKFCLCHKKTVGKMGRIFIDGPNKILMT